MHNWLIRAVKPESINYAVLMHVTNLFAVGCLPVTVSDGVLVCWASATRCFGPEGAHDRLVYMYWCRQSAWWPHMPWVDACLQRGVIQLCRQVSTHKAGSLTVQWLWRAGLELWIESCSIQSSGWDCCGHEPEWTYHFPVKFQTITVNGSSWSGGQ